MAQRTHKFCKRLPGTHPCALCCVESICSQTACCSTCGTLTTLMTRRSSIYTKFQTCIRLNRLYRSFGRCVMRTQRPIRKPAGLVTTRTHATYQMRYAHDIQVLLYDAFKSDVWTKRAGVYIDQRYCHESVRVSRIRGVLIFTPHCSSGTGLTHGRVRTPQRSTILTSSA